MADRKAVANTAWSLNSTWDGGASVPGAGDNVYLNGFAVTLDTSPTVALITTLAGGTVAAVAGGSLTSSVTRTLTANLLSGTTTVLLLTHAAGQTFTLNGNAQGSATTNGGNGILVSGSGAVVINGNLNGGAGGTSAYGLIISGGNPSALTVSGTVTGGTGNSGFGIQVSTASTPITLNGLVSGGPAGINAHGVVLTGFSGSLTCTAGVSAGAASNAQAINMTASGTATLSVAGPFGISVGASIAIALAAGGTINGTITPAGGGVTVPSGSAGLAFVGSTPGTINWVGDVINNGAAAGIVQNSGVGTLNLTGNAQGGPVAGAYAIQNGGAGILNVTGNLQGGAGNNTYGAQNNASGTINVTGNVTGGAGSSAWGIYNPGTGPVNVFGTVQPGPGSIGSNYGITSASTGPVFAQVVRGNDFPNSSLTVGMTGVNITNTAVGITVDALEYGSGGYPATNQRTFFRNVPTGYVKGRASNAGVAVTLGTNQTDYPTAANVRDGIAYNFGTQAGTCKVPPAGSVALGVPVDATTGTAALSPAALLGAPLLARLANVATVQTNGEQLAAAMP